MIHPSPAVEVTTIMSLLRFGGRPLRLAAVLCALVHADAGGAAAQSEPTRSTGAGPEYRDTALSSARLWQDGDPGERLHLRGRVVSVGGEPVDGAQLIMWQADGGGSYHPERYRTRLYTAENGEFRLTTAVPGQYYGLAHIHVMVSHPNFQPLTTRVLFKGDPYLGEADDDLAIMLEEVRKDDATVMVGSVQFVLEPL